MSDRTFNHAIIHLTDTHFPSSGLEQAWVGALVRAFGKLAKDEHIRIVGLAVTGDLVDSPNAELFEKVRNFLQRAATALGLNKPAADLSESAGSTTNNATRAAERTAKLVEVDWDRVWIVDGNHDYRSLFGLYETNKLGIEKGGHFKRFYRYPVEENVGPILVLGMNSSDEGSAARGRVRLDGLRAIQGFAEQAGDGFKYRVALVHHHLLPLPDRPPEFDDTRIEKLKRKIYDESTKLLSNAGLVTDILLQSSIDLVLHGHEHKQFAASVKYHDRAGQFMAVVGGPAARDGFQVVTFAASGDVELSRYKLGAADYEKDTNFLLWSYEDWKRVTWERLRRTSGYFRKVVRRSELSESGDYRQISDITDIFGGDTDIEQISIIGKSEDPSALVFDRVREKTKSADVPNPELPEWGNDVEYRINLDPPAKRLTSHPGYVASRISGDNFMLTRDEMVMRRPEGPFREFTRFHYHYPVEQLVVTFDYPIRYAPQQVEVRARLRNVKGMPEDPAETLRIRRNKFYDVDKGQLWLSLDWIAPTHQYEIAWDLPSVEEADAKDHDLATIGEHYLSESLALSETKRSAAAGVLATLQQQCFERIKSHAKISGDRAKVFQSQRDELSLWAFDRKIGKIRPIAATYESASPFWQATLPWAAGIRGRAMQRRTVEYYRKRPAHTHSGYYYPLEKCEREAHLLCVPIFLPPGMDGKEQDGICRIVAVLASVQNGSLLHHLHDVTLRKEIADVIFFEVGALIKGIVASGI